MAKVNQPPAQPMAPGQTDQVAPVQTNHVAPGQANQVVYVQQVERNGLGTSSFVLGIIGTVFGLIPILGYITLVTSVVGLGLGLGNIGRLRKHKATNKVMTGIGIGLSVLGIVVSIIGVVYVYNSFSKL